MNGNRMLIISAWGVIALAWSTAIAGVFRGHAIQFPSPLNEASILLAGMLLLFWRLFLARKADSNFWIVFASLHLYFIMATICNFSHRHYVEQGRQLYEKGFYEQALAQHRKVFENRYLQFHHSVNIPGSLMDAAKCHSQLGDFHEARNLYLIVKKRYTKWPWRNLAEDRLRDLKEGLEIVANLKSETNVMALQEIAIAYQFKLFNDNKAIETYEKIIEVTDSDRLKSRAKERIEALTGHINEP